ncbi:cardiolipin synthase [Lactobacillus ultunensis]|uniref:Cardiolipin synthase n=1 Tax=Lactobacillus ultunensis DSM 16047 TaxID=525365 RepID=C2EKA5_9LACO|nr:cardiolipin synthase [Lactobacillus ultunensis]EEJ73120.1 phospholipase D domain protein [Lactobacillus ultunensis DSM 16047]QQP29363.1 cardiolipin synthase [Lactobacillus ultunensis]
MMLTWDVIRRTIEVLWLINIAFAVWTVFRSQRSVVATWAWMLVLTVLPGIGFILYLFFGRQLSQDEIFAIQEEQKKARNYYLNKQRKMLEGHDLLPEKERVPRARMLSELNLNNDDAILTFANKVKIFTDGPQLFEQMIKDIRMAKKSVSLEFYTFYADNLGKRVLNALEEAAKNGAKVRVIYDTSGSRGTKPAFFDHLRELGGQAQPFISTSKKHWFTTPRLNYHLHRKLVIIDHEIGYIGGFNIGDQYVNQSKKFGHWRDTHLRVVGQSPVLMEARFAMDWNTSTRRTSLPKFELKELKKFTIDRKDFNQKDNVAMQIVSSGPDNQHYGIRRGYEGIIASAKKYIYIQTPYLIPEDSILEALIVSANSGVDVRIMIPCMPDHPFVYRATEYYAKYLVAHGVKVYKYNDGFIHAKTMVSGSDISSVGSANQDFRSYTLNFEVNSFNYNPVLAQELKTIFEKDLEECTLLTNEYFAKQSSWLKFKQYFSRLLSPIF